MAVAVVDKLSFVSKLSLLTRATSDESDPTPGYMLPEINKISFESAACCEDLVDWLIDRLNNKSCHIKIKVLRVMKYLVTNGHPQFRQSLRKKSQVIAETTKHSGPPDPLHGSAPYLSVRQEAKELSSLLFTVDENDSGMVDTPSSSQDSRERSGGMGSRGTGTMQGFGNTAFAYSKSLSDTVRDGLQDLAYQAAGLAHGNSDVTFETVSPASQFHNYRPVTVPTSSVDHSCCPVEAMSKKTSSKTPAKHRRGVAGGGWDDEEDDHDAAVNTPSVNHSVSSNSTGMERDSNGNSSLLEDCTAETRLVNDFTQTTEETLPRRNELDCFIASCSNLNCDKVVKLLCHHLDDTNRSSAMRSLLALEWLLVTDLIAPDHIAVICSRTLISLYKSDATDQAVQQKARKIIRILEKLSPKQAHLFSRVSASNSVAPASISNKDKTELNNAIQSAENTNSKDITTTAFPFLLQSKMAADC